MELLDLSRHHGPAILGKGVALNDTVYRVEPMPGSADGSRYLLVNEHTALALHAVQFFPNAEGSSPGSSEWVVAVPGGRAALTLHSGPFEPPAPWTAAFDGAYRARAEGDHATAELLIRQVLAQQPKHVLAMNHLAGTLMMQKRWDEALPIAEAIVLLEPNYQGFVINFIRSATLSSLATSRQIFQTFRPRFPVSREMDALGARLMLELGRPQEVLDLLGERADPPFEPIRAAAVAMLDALARAAPLVEAAHARLDGGDSEAALALFSQAHKVFPQDPYVLANLGFALSRAGQYGEAARALVRAMSRLPLPSNWLCCANGAFALLESGEPREAARLLEVGLEPLLYAPEDPATLFADLPSVAIVLYPSGVSKEALPHEALLRLERLANVLEGTAPPAVARLIELYRIAVRGPAHAKN